MPFQNRKEKIIIIDFGSQVTKLIARRIRELGVFIMVLTLKKSSDYTIIEGKTERLLSLCQQAGASDTIQSTPDQHNFGGVSLYLNGDWTTYLCFT